MVDLADLSSAVGRFNRHHGLKGGAQLQRDGLVHIATKVTVADLDMCLQALASKLPCDDPTKVMRSMLGRYKKVL